MKYKIVFSIPVHEKYEVVIDLVLNILHFNPNCAIVLHYARGFRQAKSAISFEAFEKAIYEIGNVYPNPETVRTGMYDIIQAHISNFKYAESTLDFDYFALTASNELFIRDGLYSHIKKYDCGIHYIDIDKNKKWVISKLAQEDTELRDYLRSQGWTKEMGSHVEGSFYRKELMKKIVNHICSFYDYRQMKLRYPREEIFFSTMLWNLSQADPVKILNPGLYSWTPWNISCYRWDILVRDVNRLIKKGGNIYSVKRVPRVIDHYTRAYIRKNAGYFESEKQYFKVASFDYSSLQLFWLDLKQEIKSGITALEHDIKDPLLEIGFINKANKWKNRVLR